MGYPEDEFEMYQAAVKRTMNPNGGAVNFALGLAGETGEVVELIKKDQFHGKPLEKTKLTDELGDVLWYLTALADHYGIELAHVASANRDKLWRRYPDGFKTGGGVRTTESS